MSVERAEPTPSVKSATSQLWTLRVQHYLSNDQKQMWINSDGKIQHIVTNNTNFLWPEITCDWSSIRLYNLEPKERPSFQKCISLPPPKKFCTAPLFVKLMLIQLFDTKGIILQLWIPQKQAWMVNTMQRHYKMSITHTTSTGSSPYKIWLQTIYRIHKKVHFHGFIMYQYA